MKSSSYVCSIIWRLLILSLLGIGGADARPKGRLLHERYTAISCRKHTALITDFGGVGDGKTSNTKAFKDAVDSLSKLADDGGAQLVVPAGKWLTGSFNLTSHFTLYLHKDAVILGSQDEADYPSIPLLPSYGKGRDAPDGRYASLIWGTNLTDVVITGNNGTIDGQGSPWWEKFKSGQLNLTRPYLIEIMYSDHIQISNLTLIDSPSWFVHPIYSKMIVIQGMTILAPVAVPNTDGIDPDSCSNVWIEDNYIVSGDDCIAVKSGWDAYGYMLGIPTEHVIIRKLTCISPKSATIALGSEMSGGIRNLRAEQITAINTESALRIKTSVGRGGYVKDIFARNFDMYTMKYVFWMTGAYGSHPDPTFDPKALPLIQNIHYSNWTAQNVTIPAQLDGIEGDAFRDICISDVSIELAEKPRKLFWNCTDVSGVTSNVTPKPCPELPEKAGVECLYPSDKLPIEELPLIQCSV